MKTQKTHKYARYFIFILLISQLWSNVLSNIVSIDYKNIDAIELSSEIEDENKKEVEDKIVFNPFLNLKFHGNLKDKIIQPKNYISKYNLEINLPPPESTLFI